MEKRNRIYIIIPEDANRIYRDLSINQPLPSGCDVLCLLNQKKINLQAVEDLTWKINANIKRLSPEKN